MKKILLLFFIFTFCYFTSSAQLELTSCDTINFADLGQCHPTDFSFSNAAFSDASCDNDSVFWKVYVDIWTDGLLDYEFSSFVDPIDESSSGDVNENGIIEIYQPATQSGEEINISFSEDIIISAFNHTLIWIASDSCGNEVFCYSAFLVFDNVDPVLECIEDDYIVYTTDDANDIELDLDRIVLSATDNCSIEDSLVFTLSDDPEIPSLEFSVLSDDTTLELFVFDENGNSASCPVNIDFIESPFPFIAKIENVFGNPIPYVETIVQSRGPFDTLYHTVRRFTDENGEFLTNLSSDDDYSIQAEFNDGNQGLSTKDILLIKKYLNDNAMLLSPFDIIACDVNNDFLVNDFDVPYLQNILLNEEVDTNLWKFLYSRIEFDDESNPFPYEEGIVHVADTNWQWKGLLGVKLGDVDHSAFGATQVNDTIELVVDNIALKMGDDYVLDFFLPEGLDVRGFQFAVKPSMSFGFFESDQITISEVNQSSFNSGRLISWSDGVTISDQPIITVDIRGRKTGELVDQLFLMDDLTAEVYVGDDLQVHPLKLNVKGEVKYETGKLSVFPNPFQDGTTVSFELENDGVAQVTVYDMSGRLVLETPVSEYQKGENKIYLAKYDFTGEQSGMYILKVSMCTDGTNTPSEVLSKRIFLRFDH